MKRARRTLSAPGQFSLALPDVSPPVDGEDAKHVARALADATPPALRMRYAQSFCAAVIARYWEKLHRRRGRDLRPPPVGARALDKEATALAASFGDATAAMSVDDAAYLVGSTYAAMLPPDFRAKHGVFYTPPPVVRRLLDAATSAGVDWAKCRVLDPACGGGAFLGPVAARMMLAMRGCERRVIGRNLVTRLRGYELDPFAAWMSLVFLDSTVYTTLGGTTANFDSIDVCDALTRDEQGAFDLVVGNPPYGRVTLPSEQRARFSRSLYGHANLYGLFLDLALRSAKRDGVIAYVTPTSFLSGEYFKRLRALLLEEASPVSLDFVSERSGVFDDVLQETLLAVYRRGCDSRRPTVHFVQAGPSSVTATPAGEVQLKTGSEGPWLLPRSPELAELAARLRETPHRLQSWGYRVSTGPLVWNRYKDQLRQKQSTTAVPLIWAESVSADGTFSFRAARRNHAPYFQVRDADGWLVVKHACVLLQRTTSKEQPRRLIAAELPPAFLAEHGAVTVENHLNMLVPIVPDPPVNTATLAAFLNSGAADRAFRCISGSVAVSAYELESMPLPSAGAMASVARLVARDATRAAIERACDRLYRAT